MTRFIAAGLLLLTACCRSYPPPEIVSGTYYFYYLEKFGKCGWCSLEHERTLSLRPDSSYLLVYLKPQGGFEHLPDSGGWSIENQKLLLHSVADTEWKSPDHLIRRFYFEQDGSLRQKEDKVSWKKIK